MLGQIDHDYDRLHYNTVVSGAMKLLNALEGFHSNAPVAVRESFGILLRVLYPVCPHAAHALWQQLDYAAEFGDLVDAPWPQVDKAALVQDKVELMLQVNGKLRGSITVAHNASKKAIETAALASADFKRFSEGRHARKVIIVPGRLVNVVV